MKEQDVLLEILSKKPPLAIELHRALLSRPAINPEHGGVGEETKAGWISHWLHENGLCHIEQYDCFDGEASLKLRPNLVAHYLPTGASQSLWIVTHMDVVNSGPLEHWASDPFILRVDGDTLYGRGVEDNNQAIVSALLLFDALKQSQCTNPIGLGLICTCAGLTDYQKGIGHVLRQRPDLFKPQDLIVVPDYGSPEGDIIEIGEKRNAWLRITVAGRERHAGFDDGPNAFEAGALFISRLEAIRERFAYPNLLFTLPTTITPTQSETSCTGANHVPAEFVLYLDLRLTPDCPLASLVNELQELAGSIAQTEKVTFSFKMVELTPDAPVTPHNAPVIRALDKAIRDELHRETQLVGVGGVTMASFIRSLGFPVAVWSIQKSGKNKADEHISLRGQIAQTRILARLLFSHERKIQRKITLTPRQRAQRISQAELAVAELVGLGLTNEAICRQLGLTDNTVRSHLKSLYRKTDARNRQALERLFAIVKDRFGHRSETGSE